MLGTADNVIAGKRQFPGVKVIGTGAGAGGRKDLSELLSLPVPQRRHRAAVKTMSSPVTAHAPPDCPAITMSFAESSVRPVVLSPLLRGELEQGRPVAHAVKQGLAAPPARLTCFYLGPAQAGTFTLPLLAPLLFAPVVFLCRLRRPACPHERLLLPLLVGHLSHGLPPRSAPVAVTLSLPSVTDLLW
ncbi:MAG: hypothetical protein ACRDRJ_30180 [Streptosporangiaceae bacterium]